MVLDVFTREQLVNAHLHDSYVMERVDAIEDVDIVSANHYLAINEWSVKVLLIALIIKSISIIYSSHNFETNQTPYVFYKMSNIS